jgi:predicted porin
MNKKLIALAVAGACVAPAAMAQTANPVTLYGRVYVTLESVEAKGGTAAQEAATKRRTRIEDQSSLLGVRGTEDLGGGLKAFFQLETAFRPDQNNTTFAARNSGVGLQGGWGSILLGRWDMPFKTTTIAVDPFGDLTISGLTGVMNDQTNFDVRAQNVMQYWSPTWGGVAVRLAATSDETRTAGEKPRMYGGSLTYTGGPIYAGYAYEQHKDATSASGTTGLTPVSGGYKETGHALFGSFTFGAFKVGALYEKFKKSARTEQKSWMANIIYTMGNNQFIYQYMTADKGGLSTAAVQPDCDSNSFAYQYNFTRRTFFLAQYTRVDNEAAGSCNFGANRLAITAGQDVRGMSLGIRHIF